MTRDLPKGDLVDRLRRFCLHLLRYPSYGALTSAPAGLSPAEHASLSWTHNRAWCFLEICGGIRKSVCELTPSWGSSVSVYASLNHWAHISDQLVASINCYGVDSVAGTNLRTTDEEDLEIVAKLIGRLPLLGL